VIWLGVSLILLLIWDINKIVYIYNNENYCVIFLFKYDYYYTYKK
jgi:hypothetical protein